MAGEASQSWWKVSEEQSHFLHGGKQDNESQQGKCQTLIKPSDFMRTHYHENSMGETALMIQSPPTRSLPRHMGIMEITIQDDI